MKRNILILVLLIVLMSSCINKSKKSTVKLSDPQTILIYENSFRNVDIDYSYNDYLSKSKNIILDLKFNKHDKEIIKKSIIVLKPLSNDVQITSLKENEKFKIHINENYKDSSLIFDFKIAPKKKYVFHLVFNKNHRFNSKYKILDTFNIAQIMRYIK